MSWIKKLVELFKTDENSNIEEENAGINTVLSTQKQMETRVKFHYPKGTFRFPLIPDEQENKGANNPLGNKVNRQDPHQRIQKNNVQNLSSNKQRRNVQKVAFQPTEIPSPIHGFKKSQSENIIEFELSPAHREEMAENSVENNEAYSFIIEERNENELGVETVDAAANLESGIENYVELENEPTDLHSQDSSQDTAFKKEQDTKTEHTPTQIGQKIETENHVPTSEVKADSSHSAPQRKHYIPYNVMMLKQDREKKQTKDVPTPESSYRFPALSLLNVPKADLNNDEQWLQEQKQLLDEALTNFKVKANVVNVTQGPAVTRFEVHPEPGVKVNKITNLSDDIKLSLSAKDIRIEAPIPGKNTVGIEVPNQTSKPVFLREILRSSVFQSNISPLTASLGLDISGNPVVTDLQKMPHGLIAGATGSGKSVCINTMLVSLLYKAAPNEVKLLLIDPKMVELAPYNNIPHLVSPVITDVKAATAALKWAVEEMERRYELFAHSGVRDIARYNELAKEHKKESLPYIVIVIDELADLMMVAPGEVEEAICRIAQKARACGIHLIVATQRPSVDVITGLIKANIPTRIAFSVSSQVDSRTIIDTNGAEKLLGKGDMLFLENGSSKPIRLQGNFVSDQEIDRVVEHVKAEQKPIYLFDQDELVSKGSVSNDEDELFYEACEFVVDQEGASTSSLQRRFRIGYNRAARLINMMEEQGIISEARGSKPRDVLISEEQLASLDA